jgi:hypothetical protein
MISARFALRWTIVGLLCALLLVAAAFLLRLSWTPSPASRPITLAELAAAAEMPLDAHGQGSQIISGTTVLLMLQPYPARVGVTSTLTLVAVPAAVPTSSDGRPVTNTNPTLYVASIGKSDAREYAVPVQPDQSYTVSGIFFPNPGTYRVRVDVYVGDDTPANILLTVVAQ